MLKNKLILGAAVVALAAAGYWYWGGDGNITARQIDTTTVDRGNIKRIVATSGAVRALVKVEVGSQLSGQVKEIYVDYNSPVEKDQVIALLDPQSFETRVLQSRADLKVAEANVEIQNANITRSEANLRVARLDYERQKPLVEKGTLSQSSLDSALAAYESAKADAEMARAQLRNAMASLEQRQAALDTAQIDLDRTKIRSPINGIVIERAVDEGQTVAASLSSPVLFNIAQDLREIQIEANVDEADIGTVKQGNRVSFAVDAFPDSEFSGAVTQVRLAPKEEQNVVTYTVIINARNPELKLLPGMTAIVEIVTGESTDVLRVRNDALRFRPPSDLEEKFASDVPVERPDNGGSAFAGGPGGASPSAAGQNPGAGSWGTRQGGGRMNRVVDEMSEQLGLSDEQQQQISKAMEDLFANMRNNGGFSGMSPMNGNADPEAMQARRESMRQRMTEELGNILRGILNEDQYQKYQQIQRMESESRRGVIWIQAKTGDIEPRPVRLGINDDSYTEVLDGLDLGEAVVTRIREVNP